MSFKVKFLSVFASILFAGATHATVLHICTPGNPGSYYQSVDGGPPVLMGGCYSAGGSGWVYGAMIVNPGDGHTFEQNQGVGQVLEAIYSSKKATVVGERQVIAIRNFVRQFEGRTKKISLDSDLLPAHMH